MNYLDKVSSEYLPEAATQLENDLILHWYPKRIVRRFKKCDSLLELGIGHGYTSGVFNLACEKHVLFCLPIFFNFIAFLIKGFTNDVRAVPYKSILVIFCLFLVFICNFSFLFGLARARFVVGYIH